jgi:hypothetical protein
MTISIAWVRHLSTYDELVFVSDSRLGDTFTFDSCPKILTLPRNDCAISFAGDTGIAGYWPTLAVSAHKARRRSV